MCNNDYLFCYSVRYFLQGYFELCQMHVSKVINFDSEVFNDKKCSDER